MRRRRGVLAAVLAAGVGMAPAGAEAQSGSIGGTVTSRATGQPMPGVQVFVQNTRVGQPTDASGRFLLSGLRPGTYTLVAQFIGYSEIRNTNVHVTDGGVATLNLQMEQTVLPLQELTVSGSVDPVAGVKRPVSIAKVTTDQLLVPTTNSALASIQGKVAGASIIRSSGQPGAGVQIMFRSPTAAELDNSPLIVVDGVVLARSFGGTTSDIEALEIESIEVIKGAAAASLYGSRAAAGVISITTRRGGNVPVGQTRVSARSEFGQSYIGNEIGLSMHHHYRLSADGSQFVDANGNPVTWNNRVVEAIRIADNNFPGQLYDNVGAVYQPGRFMTQNVSLSQNSQNTTFFVSLNRYDEAGALTNNDGYWRNTGRISLDHRIGDKFSVSLNGQHARTLQDEISGNPYLGALQYPPNVDLKRKDATGQYLQLPDSTVAIENPLWRQASRDNWERRDRTLAGATVRFSPIRWMTLDGSFSYDRSNIDQQVYVPKGTPLSVTQDNPSDGQIDKAYQGTDAYNGSISATLVNQFGNLNARATLRALMEREKSEEFGLSVVNFMVSDVEDVDAAYDFDEIDGETLDIRANGYLANVGLDYRDKYIFDGLIRRDGSSLFGPDERWHTYYRAALAYRLSQESWFQVPWINEFKLRASEGTAGGRPGYSHQYERWGLSRANGLTRNTAGNSQLRPQWTREREFGTDIIAFDNRLSLELTYATQKSRDQIIILPATTMTGFNSVRGNAGVVKGHTYEATITARVVNANDFSLNVIAVADRSRNKLVEWGRACFYGTNAGREHEFNCPGASYGDFWIHDYVRKPEDLPVGVRNRASEFQVNDEGYLVWVGTGNRWTEGISKNLWGTSMSTGGLTYNWGEPIKLLNEQNVPQFLYRGTSLPDMNFGVTTSIRWKNLSAYTEWRGQLGGKVYNDAKQDLYNQLRHADLDQFGKPDSLQKDVRYYQRIDDGSAFITRFLEDGTHLKLGAVNVSYRFGREQLARFLGGAAPQSLSIGLTGRNLLTFTGYTGFDPERGSQLSRVEQLGYPHLRSFTAVVDITF